MHTATESQIRHAVAEVLNDLSYRLKAEVIAEEMAGLDAATVGANLLEELAGTETLARSA